VHDAAEDTPGFREELAQIWAGKESFRAHTPLEYIVFPPTVWAIRTLE